MGVTQRVNQGVKPLSIRRVAVCRAARKMWPERRRGRHAHRAYTACTLRVRAAGAVSNPALDPHSLSHRGHARPGVRNTVHHDKAVEADSHAAVDTTTRSGRCMARKEAPLRYKHRRHRLASKADRRIPIDEKSNLGTSRKSVLWLGCVASATCSATYARIVAGSKEGAP